MMTETAPEKLSFSRLLMLDMRAGSMWGVLKNCLARSGYMATLLFRISAACHSKGLAGRIISGIFYRLNLILHGCDIQPVARIGPRLYMAHTPGIVIGPVTAGENLTIYHGVTLVRRRNDKDDLDYPVIGDNVVIYSGACVLGGVHIGDKASIGANAVVLEDVPAGAVAVGVPARIIGGIRLRKPECVVSALLLLLVAVVPAQAADFCVGGSAHPPQCIYDDVRTCQRAADPPGSNCMVNPDAYLTFYGGGRYCTLNSARLAQCLYSDRSQCNSEAGRTGSLCIDRNGMDENNPFRFDNRVQN